MFAFLLYIEHCQKIDGGTPIDHSVHIDNILVKCKPNKCMSSSLTDFLFSSDKRKSQAIHSRTLIVFHVSLFAHVSLLQGFLQASQFAKSSRGKPPRSHSLSDRDPVYCRENYWDAPLTQCSAPMGGKRKIS